MFFLKHQFRGAEGLSKAGAFPGLVLPKPPFDVGSVAGIITTISGFQNIDEKFTHEMNRSTRRPPKK